MNTPLTPAKAVKRLRKLKIELKDLELFKTNLLDVLHHSNDSEHESYHVHLVRDFLKNTYYKNSFFINTKDNKDLVIHSDKNEISPVSVIIETKRPSNLSGMPTLDDLNAKALQELLLYYLDERIHHTNEHITHLVITNSLEWFIFDAHVFDKYFYKNKKLLAEHKDYDQQRMSGKGTDYFYTHIAKPFIDEVKNDLEFTYVDIRKYKNYLNSDDPEKNKKLAPLYKVFSPDHLLKLPVANDSNSLDRKFYEELLYMIGLKEVKQGSKKLIDRYPEKERQDGSLIENAMMQLDEIGKIGKDQYYNTALELCITWVNRILFLKLLESQLISYHKGDASYRILDSKLIHNYDDLNKLFFQILAKERGDRNPRIADTFAKVPYLNSSLFESTDIEKDTILMSNLEDDIPLPIFKSSVLKHKKGESLNAIEYLFKFLDAYDFSSEGNDEIQEERKTLINASVLGLIFEKINGYKDGSYFTPGFITEYMSRETIRRAVVQKFNEAKGWDCKDLTAVYNKGLDIGEANRIVNSLKICDPAVGSGHFLVSALNEILAIKHFLGILCDIKGKRLFDYQVEVQNDDLLITHLHSGDIFEYDLNNPQSRDIQQGLFHEKQTIIENCLFGVDINPNSVKICRLRLWIELLKNAYYKNDDELETLPNIDINIKCGNSLISRFDIKADLGKALKKSKYDIDSYRNAVHVYQNAKDKDEKRKMQDLIDEIKGNFRTEIYANDPKIKRLFKLQGDLFNETNQQNLFSMNPKEKAAWDKKIAKLSADIQKLDAEIEAIKNNKVYENAFEWRFEFPEVLDNNGDFIGFDVVIGNPPYISAWDMYKKDENIRQFLVNKYNKNNTYLVGHWDLYIAFILLSLEISNPLSYSTYIIPNPFMREKYAAPIRQLILNHLLEITLFEDSNVFNDVARRTIIYLISKKPDNSSKIKINYTKSISSEILFNKNIVKSDWLTSYQYRFNLTSNKNTISIINKIEAKSIKLGNICYINYGAQVSSKEKGKFKKADVVTHKKKGNHKKFIEGKDIHRWLLDYRNLWLDYRKNELYGPRFENLFENPKIILRKVSDKGHKIAATIDKLNYYTDDGCVLAVPYYELKNVLNEKSYFGFEITRDFFSIEYLLANILSNISTFYFKNRFSTESLQGETSHTYPKSVRQFPILVLSKTSQEQIIQLVNQILIKKQDKQDIYDLQNKLNIMIYKLYGLTEDEIKVVEGDE